MIFVTGATGLLGNCIVRELCARGERPRVLCRKQTSPIAFDGLDVQIIEGDLEQPQVLQSAIEGCSAVIHSAAMIHIGWERLPASRRVNVEGTANIVHACQTVGARLIHVSTVDTLPAALDPEHPISEDYQQSDPSFRGHPKPRCTYVISKSESEQVVVEAIGGGLDAVIIHPGFMLGPWDWKPSSGRMMLEVNRAPIVAAPPGGCSVCDARDVAAAIVNAITMGRAGEHYILAGENMRYRELWTRMLQATGRRRRVYQLGSRIRWIGNTIDFVNRLGIVREGDVNGASIQMGSVLHFYDSSKATKELGYQRRAVDATLADAWQWLSDMFGR
jgi:dihydroflavonol-4-reductase